MKKVNDILGHPSMFAVIMCNDEDEQAKVEYFKSDVKAHVCFNEADQKYDNVYLFQLMKCSERKDD